MNISSRIRILRNQKSLTVNKLANLSGISQSYLRDIEHNRKKPSVEILSLLCDALGITMKDFFDEDVLTIPIDNELLERIQRLTDEQRDYLCKFLKTI